MLPEQTFLVSLLRPGWSHTCSSSRQHRPGGASRISGSTPVRHRSVPRALPSEARCSAEEGDLGQGTCGPAREGTGTHRVLFDFSTSFPKGRAPEPLKTNFASVFTLLTLFFSNT